MSNLNVEEQAKFPHLAIFIANQYFSTGIHPGIQAAHCLQNINLSARFFDNEQVILYRWANIDKTIWIKRGGMQSEIRRVLSQVVDLANTYGITLPRSSFCEEQDAANGTLTSVGFITPFTPTPTDLELQSTPAQRRLWKYTDDLIPLLPKGWAG